MKLSFRNRFLLPTLAAVFVGMALATVVSYVNTRKALTDAVDHEIRQIARSGVTLMESWVGDRKLDIQNWGEQKVIQSALQDSSADSLCQAL